mmetsp:Transcript_31287/g.57289  ORF Transcript_31287/g.57289 Transcript_31287/m.57289 type:complete len:230 (+) Transcript_31287:764-1453(+)
MDHDPHSSSANSYGRNGTGHVLAATTGRKLMLGTTWQEADSNCTGVSVSSALSGVCLRHSPGEQLNSIEARPAIVARTAPTGPATASKCSSTGLLLNRAAKHTQSGPHTVPKPPATTTWCKAWCRCTTNCCRNLCGKAKRPLMTHRHRIAAGVKPSNIWYGFASANITRLTSTAPKNGNPTAVSQPSLFDMSYNIMKPMLQIWLRPSATIPAVNSNAKVPLLCSNASNK